MKKSSPILIKNKNVKKTQKNLKSPVFMRFFFIMYQKNPVSPYFDRSKKTQTVV
jgi:hypothetical protein